MASLGWAGAWPKLVRDQGLALSVRGSFSASVLRNHDPGSGPLTQSKESMTHAYLHGRPDVIPIVERGQPLLQSDRFAGGRLARALGGGGCPCGAGPALTVRSALPVMVLSAVSMTVSICSPGVTRVISPRPVSVNVCVPPSSGDKGGV